MGARIIQLAEVRAQRLAPVFECRPPANKHEPRLVERFHFWSGASRKRYVHTVYNVLECPELPDAVYLLVRCDASSRRTVLSVGRLGHGAPSLNLAELRQRSATVGANEVHVHLLATSDRDMKRVEFDLRAGQVAEVHGLTTPTCH